MFLKGNETVNNSNINEMEEQGFPPSQALTHNIISTYEMIRMINPIHIPIVPINGLGLVNYYISPYIICLSLSFSGNVIISII